MIRRKRSIRKIPTNNNVDKLKKEIKMSSPDAPKPQPPTINLLELVTKFDRLTGRVSELEDRVVVLEANLSKNEGKDTISGLAFDFLRRHKGIKFNSGTIAANVEGLNSSNASTLIRLLINKYPHNIKFEKKDGLSGMYWYEDSITQEGLE